MVVAVGAEDHNMVVAVGAEDHNMVVAVAGAIIPFSLSSHFGSSTPCLAAASFAVASSDLLPRGGCVLGPPVAGMAVNEQREVADAVRAARGATVFVTVGEDDRSWVGNLGGIQKWEVPFFEFCVQHSREPTTRRMHFGTLRACAVALGLRRAAARPLSPAHRREAHGVAYGP